MRRVWLCFLPFLMAIKACEPEPEATQWFATCGDPVCSGYSGPFEGVPLCTDETIGDACDNEGETCDPQDGCNARLICATEDPTAQPGGCPVSRRKFKHDIHYLTDGERAQVAADVSQMKIATWSYNWETKGSSPHLGFIIDDAPESYAVTADGNHVDLYGYTSMTLAAVQAQQVQLQRQQQTIAEQEARIARLEVALQELTAKRVAGNTR